MDKVCAWQGCVRRAMWRATSIRWLTGIMNFQIYKRGQTRLIDDNSSMTFFLEGSFHRFLQVSIWIKDTEKQFQNKNSVVCFPSGLWLLMITSWCCQDDAITVFSGLDRGRWIPQGQHKKKERWKEYLLRFEFYFVCGGFFLCRATLKSNLLLRFSSGTCVSRDSVAKAVDSCFIGT